MSLILFVFVCLSIYATENRYEMELTPKAKELLMDVYIEPLDPNDPIYGTTASMKDDWIKNYGNSERSLLFYNVSALVQATINQERRIQELEQKIASLEADPNEVEVNNATN